MNYLKTMTEFISEDIKVNMTDDRHCKIDLNDNVRKVIDLINREYGGDIDNLKDKNIEDLLETLQELVKSEMIKDVVFDGVSDKTNRENLTKARESVLNLCSHVIAMDVYDHFKHNED